jgi:hypothetical protein
LFVHDIYSFYDIYINFLALLVEMMNQDEDMIYHEDIHQLIYHEDIHIDSSGKVLKFGSGKIFLSDQKNTKSETMKRRRYHIR